MLDYLLIIRKLSIFSEKKSLLSLRISPIFLFRSIISLSYSQDWTGVNGKVQREEVDLAFSKISPT